MRTIPVLAVLVTNLSARLATPVLPVLEVARVEVGTDDAFVELCARDVAQRGDGMLVLEEPEKEAGWRGLGRERRRNALDKAEPARRLEIPVETHDDTLHLTHAAEQLVDLLLCGEEAAVGRG